MCLTSCRALWGIQNGSSRENNDVNQTHLQRNHTQIILPAEALEV